MAWLSGWSYRKEITITGQSGAGTDYQVELDIGDSAGGDFHLEGHCTNFPQDITVTDNDGTTLLDFWIEDITADPVKIWVKVADDLGSNQTIYIYYNKSGATTESDGNNTFKKYDGFEDGDTTDAGDLFVLGTNKATTDQARSGIYSMETVTDDIFHSVALGDYAVGSVSVIQWVYLVSTTGRQTTIHVSEEPDIETDAGPYMKFEDGNIYAYNGSSWIDTTLNYNVGWNKIEIIPKTSTTFDLIVDDGTPKTGIDNRQEIANIDRVGVGGGTEATAYRDDYIIRKYNSPEPAFSSAGSEETAVETKEYSVDSILKATNTKEYSVDSIIQKTNTRDFSIDATLTTSNENKRRSVVGIFPVPDGSLNQLDRKHVAGLYRGPAYPIQFKTFSIDSILQATETKDFTTDSYLANRLDKTFSVDVILETTETKTFSIDAALQSTNTKDFSINCILETTETKDFTTDAILVNRFTKEFSADGYLVNTLSKEFSTSAILKETSTKDFSVDAILFAAGVETKTFTIDSILQATQTKEFTTDSQIVNRHPKEFTIDALLVDRFTKAFTTDSILVTRGTKDYTIDAILQLTSTKDFTADAILKATWVKELTIDAYLQSTETKPVTIDAILLTTGTKGFTLDAILTSTRSKEFTTDAILGVGATITFNIDAVIILYAYTITQTLSDTGIVSQTNTDSGIISQTNTDSGTITQTLEVT